MNIPENLKYTKSHEWVLFSDDSTAKVGLTDYAQHAMGSLVFANLPEEGDDVTAGENLGDVESVKAVADVLSPFSGTIAAVNEELLDAPQKINEDPYGSWLVEVSAISEQVELLDAADYAPLCKEED